MCLGNSGHGELSNINTCTSNKDNHILGTLSLRKAAMLKSVLLVVAISASFHNIKGELEAKYHPEGNKMLESNHWTEEKIEKQMRMFGVLINEQGKKMEKAENEINNLKSTIQRQETEMNLVETKVKLMEKKMEKYENIVNEQAERLNDKENVIQDLERTVINQDKEIARIREEMVIRKGKFRREDSYVSVQEDIKRNLYNKYQTGGMGTIRTEEKNPDFAADIPYASEHEHPNWSNFTSGSPIEMSNPSEQTSGKSTGSGSSKSINTLINDKKTSLNKMVSFQHRKDRQVGGEVAFSAYLSNVINNMNMGYTIKCDQVLLNDGNAYSPYTGAFTVPQTGVYLLTFTITASNSADKTHVKLVSNNKNIVDAVAYVTGGNHHVMGGNTAIVRLISGEKVWMEIYAAAGVQLYSLPDYRWVTFSGVFLYS